MDWDNVVNMNFDGEWFVFTDKNGREARLDKDAVKIAVCEYKINNP